MPESNDPNTYLDQDVESVTLPDFVHKELIIFPFNGCERSTQSVCDGLKPSQRKILWACLEKNVTKEQKVTQLGGLISEKVWYQHREQPLFGTIVKMAQNDCGTNKSTCSSGPSSAGRGSSAGRTSTPRFLFTRFLTIMRAVSEGRRRCPDVHLIRDKHIGPMFVVQVVPMILINGADGIGSGWRTAIENHNSHDVITNCRRFIPGDLFEKMTRWFRGWKGTVVKEHDVLFAMFGRWRIAPTTVEVIELPLEVWTEKYKKHPETLFELRTDSAYTEHHKINTARFVVEFCDELDDTEVLQQLKLTWSTAATNVRLFDRNCMTKR